MTMTEISNEWTDAERLLLISLEASSLRELTRSNAFPAAVHAGVERILFLSAMSTGFLENNRSNFEPLIERAESGELDR